MPQYTFKCDKCESIYTVEHGILEDHPDSCQQIRDGNFDGELKYDNIKQADESCNGKLLRVFDPFNFFI